MADCHTGVNWSLYHYMQHKVSHHTRHVHMYCSHNVLLVVTLEQDVTVVEDGMAMVCYT